jgi:hypothetical protein
VPLAVTNDKVHLPLYGEANDLALNTAGELGNPELRGLFFPFYAQLRMTETNAHNSLRNG